MFSHSTQTTDWKIYGQSYNSNLDFRFATVSLCQVPILCIFFWWSKLNPSSQSHVQASFWYLSVKRKCVRYSWSYPKWVILADVGRSSSFLSWCVVASYLFEFKKSFRSSRSASIPFVFNGLLCAQGRRSSRIQTDEGPGCHDAGRKIRRRNIYHI